MPPTRPPDIVYCDESDVIAVLSAEGVDARLDDDQDEYVTPTEGVALTNAINWATAEINLYIGGQYDPVALATSWKVNEWATDLAARRVCQRRGNPVPESLDERCGNPDAETGHYHQLASLMRGAMSLSDINSRVADQPGVSNVRVDPRFVVKQIRVERPLSDQSGRRGLVSPDYFADYVAEP